MSLIDIQRRLLTIDEVAAQLGVTRRTVQRKIQHGQIPAYPTRWAAHGDPRSRRRARTLAGVRAAGRRLMAPRISPRFPPRSRSSYEVFRDNPEHALPEQRAFWNWATVGAIDGGRAEDALPEEELRVLSKATSGGGFLVPTDVAEMIIAAARAASAVAQVAAEVVTAKR